MIKTLEDYQKQYNLSVSDPEKFWNDYSGQFIWRKKATKILDWNFKSPDVKWFKDGSLNITENIFSSENFLNFGARPLQPLLS